MSFNSELNQHALEVTMTKPYHSQTCFNNILEIYLNEKLNVYCNILVRRVQINARFRKLCLFYYIYNQKIWFTRTIFFLILEYNSNHQYNTQ